MKSRAVRQLRRYRPFRTLARSSAGDLLEAADATGERLTLEVLRDTPPDPESAVLLRGAIEALRSLPPHLNILQVLSAQLDLTAERPWILVVEPVEGCLLADWALLAEPSTNDALRIGFDIATALQVAHDVGVVHGALSFHTVLVTEAGIAKVMDFGLVPPTFGSGSKESDVRSLARLIGELLPERDPSTLPAELASLLAQAAEPGSTLRPSAFAAALLRLTDSPGPPKSIEPALTDRQDIQSASVLPEPEPSVTQASAPAEPIAEDQAPAEPLVAEPDAAPMEWTGAKRRRRRSSRLAMVAIAIAALLVAGTLVRVFLSDGWPPQRPGDPASPPAATSRASSFVVTPPAPTLIVVPNVIGLTATKARRRLIQAGLQLAEVRPRVGPPGIVIATKPAVGASVESKTPVILIIGVEPERLISSTPSP